MENIEYTQMAFLYDKFYNKKDYTREVEFIKQFIDNNESKILDAGCGSGTHAKILHDSGYNVIGFDKSPNMIEIANEKIENHFFVDDILNIKHKEKYDLIISFFAVFNHLKNYREFKISLLNLKNNLKANGKIIIDLHNPQKNGTKLERVENAERIMKWRKNTILHKEFTKIIYFVDNKTIKTKHIFKIFNIKKLNDIAKSIGFSNIDFFENYNITKKASKHSKNIQMVLSL